MTHPVQAISPITQADPLEGAAALSQTPSLTGASFGQMLSQGVEQVNTELLQAEAVTRAFATGEDIPIHQVTYAIEHARLSFELLSQVRTRLVEGYQELLRMQI